MSFVLKVVKRKMFSTSRLFRDSLWIFLNRSPEMKVGQYCNFLWSKLSSSIAVITVEPAAQRFPCESA